MHNIFKDIQVSVIVISVFLFFLLFFNAAYATDNNTVVTNTASTQADLTNTSSNPNTVNKESSAKNTAFTFNPIRLLGRKVFAKEDASWAHSGDVYDKYEWGFMGYVGGMAGNDLANDLYFDYGGIGPGTVYSFEVDRQLPQDNWARRFFKPVVSTIELAANVVYETDPTGPLEEFNPYFVFRWRNFPWNHKVLTTLGIGEGISWASHNPQQEIRTEEKAENARHLLNYVMVEVTFASPEHPEWEFLYRLHHRSGAFGLYCPGILGSTAVGFGVRYWME